MKKLDYGLKIRNGMLFSAAALMSSALFAQDLPLKIVA